MSRFGDYIKNLRLKAGLSLRDVEKLSENQVSNSYLWMIENDKRPAPHPNILKILSEVYNVKLEQLMKVAGYLEITDRESKNLEIENLFNEAVNDPSFDFGHRLKGKVTPEVKKAIAELYRQIKETRKN